MSSSTTLLDLIAQSQSSKEVTANALFDAGSPATLYGRRASLCSGLTWAYYGGNVTLSSGSIAAIANGTLTLSASATNYVVASMSSGAVSSSTSNTNWNDTANYFRLYSVVTGASTVTSYTDVREIGKMTGGGSTASGLSVANWATARVYHVGQFGGMYASVAAAVTAINAASPAPSATNRVVILVWPGKYTSSSSVTIPAYVGVVGVNKGLVQFQNDTTDMFTLSGDNWLDGFLVEGSATSTVYAINCNNSSRCHVRNVDMLNNGGASRQKFLKQSGSTWATLFIEHCIIDYYATSGYAILLENTSGAARYVDTEINDLFSDAYQLTGYGGSVQARGCQDIRVRGSQIRGQATYNTGVRVELNSVSGTPWVEFRNSFLAGGVPIYNEASTNVILRNVSAEGALFDGAADIRASQVSNTASVSVTTADVTLKGQEHCAPYLTTTGTLTGNRNVIVPNNWQGIVFCNNSGAFTTTFKTAAGSGVVVAQGKRAVLVADGTNVVRVTPDT